MKVLALSRTPAQPAGRLVCSSTHKAAGFAGCIAWVLLIVAWALGVSAPAATASAAPKTDAYFAEPGSGSRVSSYEVDLVVRPGAQRQFTVPRDCDAITLGMADGMASSRRVVDRRLWQKVAEDCWFYNFLHRHGAGDFADYVSDYDFMNARLSDLPIDQDCVMTPPERLIHNCQDAVADEHGILKSFPMIRQHEDPDHDRVPGSERRGSECVLRDGLFYGELLVRRNEIRCTAGKGRPSLRLIAVDFADINGDRILDAVLRFVPIGPGAARSPLILPLTRLAPDAAFSVPERDFASK